MMTAPMETAKTKVMALIVLGWCRAGGRWMRRWGRRRWGRLRRWWLWGSFVWSVLVSVGGVDGCCGEGEEDGWW